MPLNHGAAWIEERIPKGRLRCVSWRSFNYGTTRQVYWRIPALNIPDNLYSIGIGGFQDVVPVSSNPGNPQSRFFYCDKISESAFSFSMWGNANEDEPAVQYSFWYEPEDADDDSHLAPLTVGRGGENRK